jgi:hypothetical protein
VSHRRGSLVRDRAATAVIYKDAKGAAAATCVPSRSGDLLAVSHHDDNENVRHDIEPTTLVGVCVGFCCKRNPPHASNALLSWERDHVCTQRHHNTSTRGDCESHSSQAPAIFFPVIKRDENTCARALVSSMKIRSLLVIYDPAPRAL